MMMMMLFYPRKIFKLKFGQHLVSNRWNVAFVVVVVVIDDVHIVIFVDPRNLPLKFG